MKLESNTIIRYCISIVELQRFIDLLGTYSIVAKSNNITCWMKKNSKKIKLKR